MDEIIMTNHGRKRIKKRLGISKKKAEDIAMEALQHGIKHSDAIGSLKRYFDFLYLKEHTANNVAIYKRKVYIFNGTTLITVLNLPNRYYKIVDKLQARKEMKENGRLQNTD